MSAPTCIMRVEADPRTGAVLKIAVCAHCEQEKRETKYLHYYARRLRAESKLSHGICPRHFAETLAQRIGD